MLKRITLLSSFLLIATVSFAHPPNTIDLSYDISAQQLMVEVKHISEEIDKHYIRKIIVRKNQDDPEVMYNQKQKVSKGFSETFDIAAEENDTIQVKMYCNKGGTKAKSITVGVGEMKGKSKDAMMEDAPAEEGSYGGKNRAKIENEKYKKKMAEEQKKSKSMEESDESPMYESETMDFDKYKEKKLKRMGGY